MVTATKTKYRRRATSRETYKARASELQGKIASQVEALTSSKAWTDYLEFASRFHQYSFSNVMLILSQKPGATQVAGFRKWQQLGRQVRKGERGIKIFGFASRAVSAEESDTGEEKRVTYFPMVTVFDVSQTDPIEGATQPDEVAHPLTGTDDLGLYDSIKSFLEGLGWSVSRRRLGGGINGYTDTSGSYEIVVDEDLAPAMAAKTLLHECAHALLHSEDPKGDYVAHRGLKETEAESVAYVVAGAFGLDTAQYTIGYVAGWSDGSTEVIAESAENVLKAAHRIIDWLAVV